MGLCENCKITMCREERDDGIGCAEFVAKDTNVLTNADRIRAMSDEELAESIAGLFEDTRVGIEYSDNAVCWLHWLKLPAE